MELYTNNKLSYPLTNKEYNMIDKVWDFLSIFNKNTIYLTDYRKNVINEIRRNYKISDFYRYEKIANKMFWNIRQLAYPFFQDNSINKYKDGNIPNELLNNHIEYYDTKKDMKMKINNLLKEEHYYRSFINKILLAIEDSIRPLHIANPYTYPEQPRLKSNAPQLLDNPSLSCKIQAVVGKK